MKQNLIKNFSPLANVPIFTLRKQLKTKGFVVLSGGIKWECENSERSGEPNGNEIINVNSKISRRETTSAYLRFSQTSMVKLFSKTI